MTVPSSFFFLNGSCEEVKAVATFCTSPDKLLVHCVMGRSRSATLFLAYLMIRENMTLVDAIEQVKTRRRIIPNWGFLKQLRELDMQLLEKRKGALD